MFLTTRRLAVLAVSLVVCLLNANSVFAQGLKLGSPDSNETLDLGAGPAVQPAPQTAPQSAPRPAAQAGEQPPRPTGADVKRTTYKSWEVACLSDNTNCAMAQIGKDSTGNPVLEMVIRKLPDPIEAGGETAVAVLDVITPLGVVLTEGLALKIDDGENAIAPFQVCTEQGCLVREPVADELISQLKRGNGATVRVVAANQGEVSSSISLSGFTAAYNALK